MTGAKSTITGITHGETDASRASSSSSFADHSKRATVPEITGVSGKKQVMPLTPLISGTATRLLSVEEQELLAGSVGVCLPVDGSCDCALCACHRLMSCRSRQ